MADGMDPALGDAGDQVDQVLEEVGERRLADEAEDQRGDGDAELGAGELVVLRSRMASRPRCGRRVARLGERLEAAAPRSRRRANSRATKKPLTARSTMMTTKAATIGASWSAPRRYRSGRSSRSRCGRRLRSAARADLGYPPAVHGRDRQGPARVLGRLTDHGDVAQPVDHEAGDRLVLALGHRRTRSRRGPRRGGGCRARPSPARPRTGDAGQPTVGLVVLVVDLADDLLEHVLEGDDARGPAVLVDHDREVAAGDDGCRRAMSSSDSGSRARRASIASTRTRVVARSRSRARIVNRTHVHDAHDVVEIGAVDQEPAEAGLGRRAATRSAAESSDSRDARRRCGARARRRGLALEADRTGEQRRGRVGEGALLGRGPRPGPGAPRACRRARAPRSAPCRGGARCGSPPRSSRRMTGPNTIP